MQILYNQQKQKALETRGSEQKTKLHVHRKYKQKRSTICLIYNPCHRLKVTEGCYKKSSESLCSGEIDHTSPKSHPKILFTHSKLRVHFCLPLSKFRILLFIPQGVVTTDFVFFYFHMWHRNPGRYATHVSVLGYFTIMTCSSKFLIIL